MMCYFKILRILLFIFFFIILSQPIKAEEKFFKLVIEGNIKGSAYLYIRPQGSSLKYKKIKLFLPGVINIEGMQSREIYLEQHLYFFIIKKSDVKVISLPQLYPVKMECHYEADNLRILLSCLVIGIIIYLFKSNVFALFKRECIADKYFVQKIIGEGGMATVYKAIDRQGKSYAIKVPHSFCINNNVSYKRFVHEALIASRLVHPYIVSIFDCSTEKNFKPFICMEYLEGKTLEELMKDKDHDLKNKIVSYAIKIAEALSYAHSQNIIHRDIKPSNIIITANNDVKLTDFGIARAFDLTSVTVSGAFVGTPIYMAPEQVDEKKVDFRADLYSLGIILYEVYAGKKPFDDSDPMRALMQKMSNEAEELSSVAEVDSNVNHIVMKLIRRDPNERYSSAEELIKDLKKIK